MASKIIYLPNIKGCISGHCNYIQEKPITIAFCSKLVKERKNQNKQIKKINAYTSYSGIFAQNNAQEFPEEFPGMKQAIHCNLLYGKPATDINACLDKSCLTIKNS